MTGRVLRWLRVSERPDPPPGAGPDHRFFRASRNQLRYRYAQWSLSQLGALAGILYSLAYFAGWDIPFVMIDPFRDWLDRGGTVSLGRLELDVAVWIHRVELFALSTFAVQAAISAWWVRLRWRLHWYLIGDEMMRIREGLWQVREQTFTIAKIQNMTVHQNIVQRFLGIGDLEVHTAGGGGTSNLDDASTSLHVAWFRGVDDPWSLRDILRDRLASHRGTGLGDDDDHADDPDRDHSTARVALGVAGPELLEAATALRDEARRLREAHRPLG